MGKPNRCKERSEQLCSQRGGLSVRGVLSKHGWVKGLDLVEGMASERVQQDFQLLLSVAAKSASWREAFNCARRINSHQGATEAANSWGKGGSWQRALQVIQTLQWTGFRVAVETLNAASSSCERHSFRRGWLWSMQCWMEVAAKGLRTSVVSLNSALVCLGSALRWHRSCHLLHAGLHRGLVPDAISLNTLVTACEKTVNWELATRTLLLQKLFAIEPDIIGRNAAVSACANAGEWCLASLLLSSSQQSGLRISPVSVAAMATAGERSNQWRVPLGMIDSYRSLTGVVCYGAALDALESWGKWAEGLSLLHELPQHPSSHQQLKPWLDPMAFSATVSACSKAQEWRHCLSLLNHVWQHSLGKQCLSTAAWNACLHASVGHLSLESLLGRMQEMLIEPDMLSYSVLETQGTVGIESARLLAIVRSRAMPLLAARKKHGQIDRSVSVSPPLPRKPASCSLPSSLSCGAQGMRRTLIGTPHYMAKALQSLQHELLNFWSWHFPVLRLQRSFSGRSMGTRVMCLGWSRA